MLSKIDTIPMKTISISFSAFFLLATPLSAFALPFQPSCKSMQQYFNATGSEKATDYENSQIQQVADDAYECSNGFVSKRTTQGMLVCYGSLTWIGPRVRPAIRLVLTGGNPEHKWRWDESRCMVK
jgi:hypothetical protein